jgi:hypothetical protein
MPVSSPEVAAKNIKTFVNVSDNDKCEMRKKWATENAFGRPILSCAGCGLRDLMPSVKEYEKKNVADLSVCFEFSENSNKVFAKLQEGVVLIVVDEEGNLKDKHVDLSSIMSSFSYDKKYFYLHPEFVDGLTLFLCDQCDHMNTHNDVAKSPLSIAARRDYGLLSRIKELEPLLDVERSLMSPFRLYASVINVSKCGRSIVSGLKGDVIMFPHDAPDVALALLRQRSDGLARGYVKVLLVGPKGETEIKMRAALAGSGILQCRGRTVYNHLIVRRKVNEALGNPDVSFFLNSIIFVCLDSYMCG